MKKIFLGSIIAFLIFIYCTGDMEMVSCYIENKAQLVSNALLFDVNIIINKTASTK